MATLTVKGKNLEVSENLHSYVDRKIGALGRRLERMTDLTVEISRESTRSQGSRYVVQVTMLAGGSILRGEVRAQDPQAAVDSVVDVLDRQIERFKGKHQRARQRAGQPRISDLVTPAEATPEPAAEEFEPEEEPEEPLAGRVVRRKRFALKPMYPEEASEEMELLGHGFFFFLNAGSGQYNVLYRREDGNYGLIEPETA